MTAYTDREEVEKLKEWWKNYGGALLIGVLLGLGLLFGNKYYTQYREQQRVAAAELYAQMLKGAQAPKVDPARAIGAKLMHDYARTPYAGMAALLLAKLDVEAKDLAAARTSLQWAIDHATDEAVQHAARLRLGRLLIAAREYDAARALVRSDAPGFEAEYLELKGDALAGLGKTDEARAAYRDALQQLPAQSSARRMLEMKLSDLAGPSAG